MARTKTIEINKRESVYLEFFRRGDMTVTSALWIVNKQPLQGWTGIAHRAPGDPENYYKGMALSVYRLLAGMTGELSAVIMRDKKMRNLFLYGQNYALNGFKD